MKIDKGMDNRGLWRAIYTSLWDDLDFRKLTPNVKLVFLNLRTSPLTNMPVIYPYYIEAIERQTGLDRKQVLRALDTLSDTHWIAIQEGIVWVKKGLKFDPNIVLTNDKHLIAIKNIILALPKLQIVRDFIDFYKINIPYPIPSRIGHGIAYANQDTDTEKEKETEKDEESEEKPKVKPLSLSSKVKDETPQPKTKQTYYPDLALTPEEKEERYRKREDKKEMSKIQLEQLRKEGIA